MDGVRMRIFHAGDVLRARLRDYTSHIRWGRVFGAALLGGCICGLAFMEGLRISVWSGEQGLAEASVQCFLAGMIAMIVIEVALFWAWKTGK